MNKTPPCSRSDSPFFLEWFINSCIRDELWFSMVTDLGMCFSPTRWSAPSASLTESYSCCTEKSYSCILSWSWQTCSSWHFTRSCCSSRSSRRGKRSCRKSSICASRKRTISRYVTFSTPKVFLPGQELFETLGKEKMTFYKCQTWYVTQESTSISFTGLLLLFASLYIRPFPHNQHSYHDKVCSYIMLPLVEKDLMAPTWRLDFHPFIPFRLRPRQGRSHW